MQRFQLLRAELHNEALSQANFSNSKIESKSGQLDQRVSADSSDAREKGIWVAYKKYFSAFKRRV